MAKLTISMPDAMGEYVASRVETGQYGNVSEYFRDLVRREQERKNAAEELSRMLAEAEASGISERKIPDIMRKVEADLRADGRL
ncbi:MAG: type II toxin-antitoxin system ParD family antitoxin [Acidobacteria bacterium]|nr:type II toxin-antitoxin system ParD family antitoxin [Acidobacteriota bacterium]